MNKFCCLVILLPFIFFCAKKSPNEPGSSSVALIYEHGGERPAAGAVVKFFESGDTGVAPCDVCTTDEKGRYSIERLRSGKYDLLAEKDSFVAFQSQVIISPNYTTLCEDTLMPASSLYGVVAVQYPRDPRTVTIRVAGIDKLIRISDENGSFRLTGIAAGTWSLLFQSTLTGYLTFTKTITIGVGVKDTLADSLRFFSADIPFVSGIRLFQDTLAGTIKISWEKTAYRNSLEYVVYKASCSDVKFPDYPTYVATDTFLVDSIPLSPSRELGRRFVQPSILDSLIHLDPLHVIDSLDTVQQCFRYRIAIRTWEQEIGPTKGFSEVQFAQKATLTTYFSHGVKYPHPVDSASEAAGASINDTIAVMVDAKNLTRPLRAISWYDPLKGDTVSRMTVRGTLKKELRDTLRYAFDSSETGKLNRLIAVVTDGAGDRWFDTVLVTIVRDIPVADAGFDTGVFTGTMVNLHGSATDKYGKITGWEWKIGSAGEWTRTGNGDTSFIAPLTEDTLICSLAVINDEGNRDTDQVLVLPSGKVQSVAASIYHTLYLKTDGTLWGSGEGSSGQLGDGAQTYREKPVQITSEVKSMCASANNTLILKNDGTLWGCGDNSMGQLGDGLALTHYFPVLIMTDVQSMAAGGQHTLILTADHTLWACGDNEYGQLGDGTMETRYFPIRITTDVKAVSAGEAHSLFIKTDGTVMACGSNESGQLGIDSVLMQAVDTAHIRICPIPQAITADGKCVFAGPHYSLILKNDNTVWGCGFNEYGQLGDSTMEDRYSLVRVNSDVKTIVTGAGFSMTIKNDNTLWAYGWNYYGNWGNGTWEDRYKPSKVTTDAQGAAACSDYGLILKTDGSVWTYGVMKKGIGRIIPFLNSVETAGE
jgi:hypothetical protein